jgi:hypothetical protein
MIEFELSDVSRRIVADLADTTEGEEALVLADPRTETVARSLTTAARALGADASLLVVPEADAHGNEHWPWQPARWLPRTSSSPRRRTRSRTLALDSTPPSRAHESSSGE